MINLDWDRKSSLRKVVVFPTPFFVALLECVCACVCWEGTLMALKGWGRGAKTMNTFLWGAMVGWIGFLNPPPSSIP